MRRLSLAVALVVIAFLAQPALAAERASTTPLKKSKSSAKGPGPLYGFGAGALFPQGRLGDLNSTSWFVHSRSLYVDRVFGGRAAAYYGDVHGKSGTSGGHVYGFDFDALLKFGSPTTFGYVFGGAGYGTVTATFTGATSGTTVRHDGWDWCWTGGIGVTIARKVYLEASYVSYQTNPHADFIPVVVGFQF